MSRMRTMSFAVHRSELDFDETVAALRQTKISTYRFLQYCAYDWLLNITSSSLLRPAELCEER
jgi:hypothetical protein